MLQCKTVPPVTGSNPIQAKRYNGLRVAPPSAAPVQRSRETAQAALEPIQPNHTGLPDNLRAEVESLSGMDLSDVRVHYNSDRPAQLQALAYTQGTDIHVAPGQEQHLPHEAWHVVQQAQGRVQPTLQLQGLGGVGVNNDARLEREAGEMGERALGRRGEVGRWFPSESKDSLGRGNSPHIPQRQLQEMAKEHLVQKPVQLKVEKYHVGAWYSSFDPYKTFGTKKEATDYDRKLKSQGREQLRARVPTLYTYTHTKPANKLSFALQGPHTVAHRVILQALIDATTPVEVFNIFDKQVLEPQDVEEIIFGDESPSSGTFSKQVSDRLERFVEDYEAIYEEVLPMFSLKNPDIIKMKHLTNMLLNMDPYAVYAWKTTTKASHKSLSGKGESLSNPTWSDLYDTPPANSFRDEANLDSFVSARKGLFDEHF